MVGVGGILLRMVSTSDRRAALRLQYISLVWNAGEVVFTLWAGVAAGSLALIGFGSDSVIEIFASLVVVWHLGGEKATHRTQRALRLVGSAFVLLAVVLGASAVRDLWTRRVPEESWPGIVYLTLTVLVMFALAAAKRRVARRTGDEPLAAEAEMSFLDGWLSAATVLGLLLNAVAGWWWADPLAGLLIALIALREAKETFVEANGISA